MVKIDPKQSPCFVNLSPRHTLLQRAVKARCSLVKMGRGIEERRIFWVKKMLRSAEFGNRNFSIFGCAAEQKWEALLEIPVLNQP